jgi:uncharacterized membrane protein (UPF0127 family)
VRNKQYLRWLILPALFLIAVLILPKEKQLCTEDYVKDLTIKVEGSNAKFKAQVAKTEPERERGLSGKKCIQKDTAMLFEFDDSGYYGIWMKGMHFSIDIVWLDNNKTVTYIEKNISPETYPKIYTPNKSSHYVIELHDGMADSSGLQIGSKLSW